MRQLWWIVPLAVFGGAGGGALLAASELGWLAGRPDYLAGINVARERSSPSLLPGDQPQPRIEVEQTEFDFGTMELGSSQSHEFVLRNIGKGPLTLMAGDTTCKCTISDLKNGTLAPGDSTTATLKWTAAPGFTYFRQSANIKTNDPFRRVIKLVVVGTIDEPVHFFPKSEIVFSSLMPHEDGRDEVQLLTSLTDRFEIHGVSTSDHKLDPYVELTTEPVAIEELPKYPGAKSGIAIRVHVKPGLPLGRFRQLVEFSTNVSKSPIKLPISGIVETGITLFGQGWNEEREILRLGSVPRGAGSTSKLQIALKGDRRRDTSLRVARVVPEFLKVTLGERVDGENSSHVALTVEVPRDCPEVSYIGTDTAPLGFIEIETGHAEFSKIEMRVHLIVEG